MRGLIPAANRREEGAVAVLVALMLVVFVAMVAIAVDAGGLYLRRRELVTGSDSAAMSAARTCARGGFDDRFASPEEAGDFHVQQNGQITALEVAAPGNVFTTPCNSQWGHATVQYTSEQSLFFAPALGFESAKPVTTTATASWGLGSNNPVPLVVTTKTSLDPAVCPIPPTGTPAIGQTCVFWFDNDRLEGGNFSFLSLNPQGWDVPIDDRCSGSGSGGTDSLTGWIDGSLPASLPINWTDPTYVCNDTGVRGIGQDVNGRPWKALRDLIGQTRDFPINWEGPGAPIPSAPDQGTVYSNGQIDKFDIIGFAFLTIVDVVRRDQAQGGEGQCTTKNNDPVTWTEVGQTLNLDTITDQTTGWQGCPSRTADGITSLTVTKAKTSDPECCTEGVDYTFDVPTRTITWIGTVPKDTKVTFGWMIDPNSGPCGQLPDNASAMCVITTYQGSTLDDTYVAGTDKNTVIRLCDFAYGTCLDQ